MKTLKKFRPAYAFLAVLILLAACGPAPSAMDSTQVAEMIDTAVVQALETEKAQAPAAPQATATEAATNTPVPIPPTLTPFPTITPLVLPPPSGSGGSGSGGGSTTPEYACDIIHQRPYDNQVFRPNDPFDIKWTIVNTGAKTWDAGFDLKYHSGPQMTTHAAVELPKMEPGDTYSVVFDANAPADQGFQVMTWTVGGFCYPYVAINVEKPSK